MARKNTRRKSVRKNRRPRPINLRRQGLKFFKSTNYDQAIAAWEQAKLQRSDNILTAALGEAYFRRGVIRQEMKDLSKAVTLQPDKQVYRYYLGLAQQREGDLDKAIATYKRVEKSSEEWADRVAYVLALALLQQGNTSIPQTIWSRLFPNEQEKVKQLNLTRQGKMAAKSTDSMAWQGIVAYANGRYAQAQDLFTNALSSSSSETTLVHYYLGCLAAQKEEWKTAVSHWEKGRANGFNSPVLTANLGEAYHRLAEDSIAQEAYIHAIDCAKSAISLKGTQDNALNQLLVHAYEQAGYQLANNGDWHRALQIWEIADGKGNGNFRLSCNLALAYEQVGDYAAAAELWRNAMRRRPRKADHPDAIGDEAVAQMWKRTAVCYQKSEQYSEACQVMKQAVKWQPDNLDMRMILVDSYVYDGRFQAAENELGRILDQNQNHIPALNRMGEVISQQEHLWKTYGADRYWKKVLEIDASNKDARQLLVEYYQNLGDQRVTGWFQDYHIALEHYQQGLQYQPDNPELLLSIADCHIALNDIEQGESILNKVLESPSKTASNLLKVTAIWYIANMPEKGVAMIEVIKNAFPQDTLTLYLTAAANILVKHKADWADAWIAQAESEYPDDPIYFLLGQTLLEVESPHELIELYLNKAIKLDQEPGKCYFMLGIMHAIHGDFTEARKQWKLAKRIARKTKDNELKENLEAIEAHFTRPADILARMFEEFDLDDDESPFSFADMEFDDDRFSF